MRGLIIGCGYLGRRVAAQWRLAGHAVTALTRSPENAQTLQALGIDPILGDVLEPASLRPLPSADCVLYAVGHDKRAAPSKREVYRDGLGNVLRELAPARPGVCTFPARAYTGRTPANGSTRHHPAIR